MSREDVERFLTDSGRSAIDNLFSEAEQESDDFDVAEVLDKSLYEALTEYDHRSALNRWLSLRFTGARTDGRLAEQAIVDILGALQREIVGASPAKDPELVKLDLVGFSRGSAILHLVPAETPNAQVREDSGRQAQGTLPVEPDRLDDALSVITELHSTAEQAGDVERFSGQEQLLRGFMALADALDKHDLDMGIVWRSGTGRRRSSELTSHGREYARQYLERSETAEIIVISGRIVEMKISGTFDIKASLAPNSPRYTVTTGGEESLLGLSLQLGQSVRVRVRKHTEQNKVGVIFGSRYEYLGLVPSEDKLV